MLQLVQHCAQIVIGQRTSGEHSFSDRRSSSWDECLAYPVEYQQWVKHVKDAVFAGSKYAHWHGYAQLHVA